MSSSWLLWEGDQEKEEGNEREEVEGQGALGLQKDDA